MEIESIIKKHILPNFTEFNIDNQYKKNQSSINIQGIDIYFPYNLYHNQIKYMEKIIELLNNKMNEGLNNCFAALESPTGTGKTLCLLCSTLAWLNEMRKQKRYGGKILYTTRTHSQITQVIHELQKTCYRPRTAILSSRDNSCVNENVKQKLSGTLLNIKCRKFYKKCPYYKGKDSDNDKYNMIDMEDLCRNGKKFLFCPFYQQIENVKKNSDIIFMPYNYIFDEDIRNIMEIDLENNIIIIDEAHNVRKVCEDSKSVEIKSNDFEDINLDFDSLLNFDENEGFIEDFIKVRKKKKSPLEEISKNDIEKEKDAIKKIQKRFNNINIRNDNKGNELNFVEFLNIFINNEEKSNDKKRKKEIKYKDDELSVDSSSYNISDNISISNLKEHIELLNKVSMIYQDVFEKGTKINILIKIFNIISQLVNKISLQKSYTFFMENEKKTIYNKDTNELDKIDIIKKFNIFCFNPEIEFIDILNSHPFSIILTSGTLTPFKLLEDELKIKFKTTLENYHIVPKEQIKFKIITNYSQNGIFCFDYENRTNIEMIKALGNEIYYFCKNTTYGGILVFFTSYIYLNKCYKVWEEYGINFKIIKYKKIFKDSSRDKNLISSLKRDSNKNYILYSVFRGSSSEGIDFSDDCARVVICIGIPFADKKENRIKLKINYINNMKRDNKDFIDGNEWYIADAMTAVNQSLGRVIRHINDYGVLVCIDERYKRFEKYFSLWIKEQNKNNKDDNILDINQFFSEQRNKFKNIIQNDNLINSKEQDKKSGFNNIINMNKNSIFNNYELEIFEEYDENTKNLNIKKGLNTGEDMSSEENHQNNNNFNRTKFGCSFKLNEENINIINAKGLGYKTNYNDIYNSLLNKKHLICKEKKKTIENKLLFEKWNITKDNKFNFIYDSEQKKGYELLESLKEFINNNPKEFNKIINKYKL